MSSHENGKSWRFLSNHTQVLLCIAQNPDIRLRDIAPLVGITERAAQRIVADLVESGYLNSERIGRRNRYTINREATMRHHAQSQYGIGELVDLLTPDHQHQTPSGSQATTLAPDSQNEQGTRA